MDDDENDQDYLDNEDHDDDDDMQNTESCGQGRGAGGVGTEPELREQDRFLPVANIARIMKTVLPPNAKVGKDAKEAIQECVSEFISFITSEASDKCQQEKRKTINGDDLLWAMGTLGFENYVEPLKIYLLKYREAVKGEKPEKKPTAKQREKMAMLQNMQHAKMQKTQHLPSATLGQSMMYANSGHLQLQSSGLSSSSSIGMGLLQPHLTPFGSGIPSPYVGANIIPASVGGLPGPGGAGISIGGSSLSLQFPTVPVPGKAGGSGSLAPMGYSHSIGPIQLGVPRTNPLVSAASAAAAAAAAAAASSSSTPSAASENKDNMAEGSVSGANASPTSSSSG